MVNSGGTLGGNGSVGDNLLFLGGGDVTVNSGDIYSPSLEDRHHDWHADRIQRIDAQ